MRTSTGQPSDQYWLLFTLREGASAKGWRRGAKEHRGAGRRQVVSGALGVVCGVKWAVRVHLPKYFRK